MKVIRGRFETADLRIGEMPRPPLTEEQKYKIKIAEQLDELTGPIYDALYKIEDLISEIKKSAETLI